MFERNKLVPELMVTNLDITMAASIAKAAFRVIYERVEANRSTWQPVTLPLTCCGVALRIRTSKNYWTVWLFRPSYPTRKSDFRTHGISLVNLGVMLWVVIFAAHAHPVLIKEHLHA